MKRKYPVGAEIDKKGTHFRIWAPGHRKVFLVLENEGKVPEVHPMHKEKDGYFSLLMSKAVNGSLYRFQLGNKQQLLPDPASRYQPQGPNGPSCVVDPNYKWSDDHWRGIEKEGHVIYEMHIGTFTQEGTFRAAMEKLEYLAELGITLIEIMPLNDFPGYFGWGYDGVNLFAPCRLYGSPNEVKAFIDKAHKLAMGVILDVVYNHLGPEANFLGNFTKKYFNPKFSTEWGQAINFDSHFVREFFLTNARYWIQEYHFDGLRVDATPWFFSSTPVHILEELTKTIKSAGGKKRIIVIGENEKQDTKHLRPYDEGGYGFDALWNDDFHHSAHVRLTGKREAYYTDYLGSPQEFISAFKYGFLYQGQYYDWQKKERGTPDLNLPPSSFIVFLENHDQVANSGNGKRVHQLSDPGNYKAFTCLLLLSPNTPMLFQGQEFGSSRPFYYFADHDEKLNRLINKGRKAFLSQFPRQATSGARKVMPDPSATLTFTTCKLDHKEKDKNAQLYTLHRDLIKLRKEDPVFKKLQNILFDGAVLGTDSFLMRYFGEEDGDRLLIINFGPDYQFNPAPEPLLVPGIDLEWEVLWSSESLVYGGEGTPPIFVPYWKILGHSAIVLGTKSSKKGTKHS